MRMRFFGLRRLLLVLIGLCLVACHSQNEEQKPKSAPMPKDEVVLSPDSPKFGYIKEAVVELSRRPLMEPVAGKIAYDETRTARVSSPIAGRVIGGISHLGAQVKAGNALLELDSPELGQAQSDYANALADLNLAERAFQRVKDLYENGILPRKDLDQSQDELARARSETERARLRLANLGVQGGGRTDNRFALHAPIAGTITERNVNPGMEVRPDLAAPLFVISDIGHLWVLMDVFEKDIGLIHVGQEVSVRVPAYPDERFPATVDYISQVVDEITRTVKVRCLLPNRAGKLLPAMYAAIDVQSEPGDRAVVVPLSALFTEGESDWLFVAIGDGHYQKRPVKVGLRLKDKAVVEEGLNPGERLVVDGALLLRTEEETESAGGEAQQ
ncbi:MAG TPA: efflux RND transporter periplasmic adaptor subunit [Methylococcaceae bacterium]|nr:efflux RND transporter periplasmic adaptor subunit [Methylococcaceae bacterium]